MKDNRTQNSLMNFITGIGTQIVSIVMNFICRTVFIATLGKTYLGLSGLFSNILTMLSLTELGIGTAITFYMYEPLAKKDTQRVLTLLDFYKKVYRIIALAVTVIGVSLIPFLPKLVKGYDKLTAVGLNAVVIYLLYLSQSVATYLFFAYRTVLIKADQKEYVLNIVKYAIIFTMNVVQMLSLVLMRNFTVYVLIMVAFTIIENIIYAAIVAKRYPYITQKPKKQLSAAEIKTILKDTGAVFLYKLNRVILKSTDNIVLSAFLGLDAVALYSNYYIYHIFHSLSRRHGSRGHCGGERRIHHRVDWSGLGHSTTVFHHAGPGAVHIVRSVFSLKVQKRVGTVSATQGPAHHRRAAQSRHIHGFGALFGHQRRDPRHDHCGMRYLYGGGSLCHSQVRLWGQVSTEPVLFAVL